MIDLRLTREFSRPVKELWAFIAADFFANHAKWDPAIVELRKLTDGPIAAGTRGLEVRNFGGRQKAEFTIAEFEQDRWFVFVNDTGPFVLSRSYTFDTGARGGRFTFHFVMRPKGVMRLLFPLFKRTIEMQARENIERLARLLA